jgi:dihydroxyacetone kinase-like protein
MEIKMDELTISRRDLVTVMQKMATGLKEHVDELRDLDAALGDGDLGVTVELGSNAIVAYLSTQNELDIGRMLAKMGMDINKVNPSTFGTLLASAFMGAGKATQGKNALIAIDLLTMGYGAVDAIKKRGKAEVGDKTMLDALVPAVEIYKEILSQNNDVIFALQKAAAASEEGMNATATMKAKYGRVSWRPDGGMGLKDGGATALYFLISSFTTNLIEIIKTKES